MDRRHLLFYLCLRYFFWKLFPWNQIYFFNLVIKEKKLFTNCCIQVSHMIWSIVLSNSCFRLVLKLYPGLQHNKCIKGTEDVISSDPLFLALYARFTRVPFSPISTLDFRENDIVGLNDILELYNFAMIPFCSFYSKNPLVTFKHFLNILIRQKV